MKKVPFSTPKLERFTAQHWTGKKQLAGKRDAVELFVSQYFRKWEKQYEKK